MIPTSTFLRCNVHRRPTGTVILPRITHGLVNDSATGDISSLQPLRVAKCHRLGSEQVVFIPGHDVVWLLRL